MSAGSTAGAFRPTPGEDESRLARVDAWLGRIPEGNRKIEPQFRGGKKPHQAADVHEAVALLAEMNQLEAEPYLGGIAEEFGVSKVVLRNEVNKRRPKTEEEAAPNGWEVKPAPMPQDTAELISILVGTIRKYIVLSREDATAVALWVLFAWTHDAHEYSPILHIKSATMRCGKTKLLTTVAWLVPRPQMTMSITGPTMYRFIEQEHPCLLVDEADAFLGEKDEMRGIINSCFDRGEQSALRMEEEDGKFKVKRFGAWCPKVFAGIGEALHPTMADRSISIAMKRKKPSDKVARLRRRDCAVHFDSLKEMLCRWAQDNIEKLKTANPALPDALHDRAGDKWEPLLAIADLAGGQWPERARNVAVILSGGSADGEDETIGVQLLADIRDILADADAIFTKPLIDRLVALEERPWGEFGRARKPITAHWLGNHLKAFGITSERLTIDGVRNRGYTMAICRDAFDRYFPQAPETPSQSVQPSEIASIKAFSAVSEVSTAPPADALKKNIKAHEHNTSDGLTLQNGKNGVGEKQSEQVADIGHIPSFLDRRMPAAVVADDEGDGWEAQP